VKKKSTGRLTLTQDRDTLKRNTQVIHRKKAVTQWSATGSCPNHQCETPLFRDESRSAELNEEKKKKKEKGKKKEPNENGQQRHNIILKQHCRQY